MKRKIILPVLLCLLMTGCGGFEPIVAEESQSAVRQGTVIVPQHTDINRSTDVSFYGMMLDAMQHVEQSVVYPDVVSEDEIHSTFIKICADHPELFWISGMDGSVTETETKIQFKFLEGYTTDELKQMYAQTVQTAEVISTLVDKNAGDYEIALAVHDFLINNTTAETAAAQFSIADTAYGCLVQHSAVSRGYAQAFVLVMHKLGIEAGMCEGTADGAAHSWNYVKLDDTYYWMDAAWDDPRTEGAAILRHAYCFVPDAMLLQNRTVAENNYFVPQCTETANNYFVRRGTYYTEYSFQAVKNVLTDGVKAGCAEMMFADAATAEAAVDDLITKKKIWNISGLNSKTTNVSYQLTPDTHALYLSFTPK